MAKSVREAAMDMLARREHAVQELKQKLHIKGYGSEEIHSTVQVLLDENLLSDTRFTEAFIHSRQQRGSGPMKIQAELRQKGISDAMIAEFLHERDRLWLDIAQQVRRKKFGEILPRDYKEKARQARFLQQRGFSSEQTHYVLKDDGFDYE